MNHGAGRSRNTSHGTARERDPETLLAHPAWRKLALLCRDLQHGEIERLKIQDGLPVLAEITRQKIKLSD